MMPAMCVSGHGMPHMRRPGRAGKRAIPARTASAWACACLASRYRIAQESGGPRGASMITTFCRRAAPVAAMLAVLLAPQPGDAGDKLDCKGVVTFADAMTRAVSLSLDLDSRTVFLRSCTRYPELYRFCHGDIVHAADHRFQFGGVESAENTRLTVKLYRDDAGDYVGYNAPWLKAYFVGRCGAVRKRWSMRPPAAG
jgi:hypothetical protein